MPEYKLYYFNFRGRGELARLIFAYAGVEYEDIRFERNEEWINNYKPKMPFKQCPALEVDGKMLAQSHTIARYLARKFGLAGKDEWEQALADMYTDCISDLMTSMRPAFLEQDPEKKKEAYQKYLVDVVTPHLAIIEQKLTENGTGYLVGSDVTWADLAYYGFFSFLIERFGDILKDAPKLKDLIDRIGQLPAIKKWIETRPVTDI